MTEPLNSVTIGVVEIFLALMVFHRAIPAMLAIHKHTPPPVDVVMETIRQSASSVRSYRDVFRLARTVVVELTLLFYPRLMALKYWALGFALGMFGVGRALPPYAPPLTDSWMFTLGHYCLVSYTVLRLRHIKRNCAANWWNHL